MRPTARGVGVALVAVAAIWLSDTTGPRALNAVAAPAIVALIAGVLQVVAGAPTVERPRPRAGFPGESRAVELAVEGSGPARIVDPLPAGVDATEHAVRATLPATVSYDVDLDARGEWTLGPPRIAVTDVLGLFVRTTTPDATATLLVYPEVRDLRGEAAFAGLLGEDRIARRDASDTVREYVPGDPLRDVHWKSSAKRGPNDLIVREFTGERTDSAIHVTASATAGHADAMATAAASVADLALSAGLSVGLTCPAGTVPAGRGDDHRGRLLELLARTDAGDPVGPAYERADVVVRADDDGVTVAVDGREHALDLSDAPADPPAPGASDRREASG